MQDDIVIKKARIAIEIREGGLRKAEVAIFSSRPVDKEVEVVPQLVQKIPQPQPLPLPIAQLPVRKKEDISLSREDLRATEKGKAKTIHQKKIANGLQHELDRLQPRPTDINKDEKRKLRSQEGTRFKSELSAYFPEYDEVIGNEPKETRKLSWSFTDLVGLLMRTRCFESRHADYNYGFCQTPQNTTYKDEWGLSRTAFLTITF